MSARIVNVLAVVMLIVLSLVMLANSMTKPLGRDEQMYCTGGVLLAQGKMIYRDFSYPSQLPYHPLLYAALFKILNTKHYLLIGRIVSSFCDILVMLCIVGIYRHIFESFRISGTLLGLAGALLFVFNPLVDYANGYAWNHDVVILCAVLAFWLFISNDFQQKSKYWRVAIIGALLTFATCMRITTALVQLLFFAVMLSQPADSIKQRFKTALPFLIAAVIVSLWPIWVIAHAPRAFFINLYWIPTLYGKWLHEIGMVHNKFNLLLSSITMPGYFVLILILAYLYLIIALQRRNLTVTELRNLILAALLPLTLFIIALIPPTMWRQYLAMPVPFLIISFAYPLFYLRKSAVRSMANVIKKNSNGFERLTTSIYFKIAAVLVTICVIIAVVSYPVALFRTPMLVATESWVPIRLHNISEQIAQKTQQPKLILTLAPLFALEGGCNIYTELSAGSIVYRIADRISSWNRDITHTIGPGTLKQLIEKSPPSAVILGVEMEVLEKPILETVIQPSQENWGKKVYENGPIVYFRSLK